MSSNNTTNPPLTGDAVERHSKLHDDAKKFIQDAENAGFYDVIAIIKDAAAALNITRKAEADAAAKAAPKYASKENAEAALAAKHAEAGSDVKTDAEGNGSSSSTASTGTAAGSSEDQSLTSSANGDSGSAKA